MTRATMRDIDEMGFNIQVWDYMNWALGDRNLGFDRRLHWMGEPVNVTTFKNADKPLSEVLDEARTVAADNDMRVWVVVQHVTGMNISGSLVLIPPENMDTTQPTRRKPGTRRNPLYPTGCRQRDGSGQPLPVRTAHEPLAATRTGRIEGGLKWLKYANHATCGRT